jgi:hypothetical protein
VNNINKSSSNEVLKKRLKNRKKIKEADNLPDIQKTPKKKKIKKVVGYTNSEFRCNQ